MLEQPHILIGGATGSGKSVVINALIYTALYDSPLANNFVLIDPKRVELIKYQGLPHVLKYASEPAFIIDAIKWTVNAMERRYKIMQKDKITKFPGSNIYVIIDEFADLMTTCKKEVLLDLCRIAQLGRAAKIHLVIATQRPTRDIINGQIKVNIDARLALRCPTARDSINILEHRGAETLPRYGQGYYSTPDIFQLVEIPMVSDQELARLVKHWEKQNSLTWKLFFKPAIIETSPAL